MVCGSFGVLISILHAYGYPVAQPVLSSVIPSIVLGLLLVFRTNTAYERYWEGRRWWGTLTNTTRNLTWQIWVNIQEEGPEDRQRKLSILRLLPAFAIAKKHYLRSEIAGQELAPLVSSAQLKVLQTIQNTPLQIACWLGDYLQQEYQQNRLHGYQLTAIQNLINTLMDAVGACERILRTPMPLAYAIHLKQLVLIYCLMLPFQLIQDLGWWTGLFVALVSFTLFGIEEIGVEIENPFGYDPNDLPLDMICATIQKNIEEFIETQTNALATTSPDDNGSTILQNSKF